MASEPTPDHPALREGSRARLFEAMDAHDLDLLVLGRVANIRYASGVPILWNAGTRPFGPGCVVVRDTEELYLLSTWDEGVPEEIPHDHRSDEHTSELQSLMRISYAVFCLKKKIKHYTP